MLADLTWVDDHDIRHSKQTIFDDMLRLVAQARRLVVADQFLFNDFGAGAGDHEHRPLSNQLTAALIQRLQDVPELQVVLITDPVNTVYGGIISPHLQALRMLGNDLDQAFPKLRENTRFAAHTGSFRATLDEALASPPMSCPGLQSTLEAIGNDCKACHGDFRG